MTTEELDLVPTRELVDALTRRNKAMVFLCTKEKIAGNEDFELSYSGGHAAACGLLIKALAEETLGDLVRREVRRVVDGR